MPTRPSMSAFFYLCNSSRRRREWSCSNSDEATGGRRVLRTGSLKRRKQIGIAQILGSSRLFLWLLLLLLTRIDSVLAQSSPSAYRTPVREVPPELDVSPEPTPPTPPTTRRPTRRPTRAPQPTTSMMDAPTKTPSLDATTATPTILRLPTSAPTKEIMITESTRAPTLAPTPAPVITTTTTPTDEPTIAPRPRNTTEPTVAGVTNQPTVAREITPEPTKRPTQRPATRAPITKRPTMKPTPRPKDSLPPISYTQRPSLAAAPSPIPVPLNSPYPASVPIQFMATLQAPTDDTNTPQQLAANCEQIWDTYIAARLRAAYRQSTDAQSRSVDLDVSVAGTERKLMVLFTNDGHVSDSADSYFPPLLRRRQLQNTGSIDVKAVGTAEFLVNGSSNMAGDAFLDMAQQDMVGILNQESLQQALIFGGNNAVVTSVTNNYNATSDGNNSSDINQPSVLRLTIGFLLLFLTLLTVLFWVYVFYKKRLKARKRKRLAELRRSQSKLARLPPSRTKGGVAASASMAPSMFYPVMDPLPTAKDEESSSDDASSSYPGLESMSDEPEFNDDLDKDPFARELQEAVSLDQMAWTELLQQKQQMDMASRGISSSSAYSPSNTRDPMHMRHHLDFLAHSEGEGFEMDQMVPTIQTINSFPYGDENDTSFQHHDDLEVTLDDGSAWNATGVTLNVVPRGGVMEDDGHFEPYGDSQLPITSDSRRTSQHAVNYEKASRYRFEYPLKQQERCDPSQTNGGYPIGGYPIYDQDWMIDGDNDVDDDADDYHSRDFDDMLNELSSDDSDKDIDPGDMLQEVARLSDYVKRYGQKKELEMSMRDEAEMMIDDPPAPNPLLERLEKSRNSPRRRDPPAAHSTGNNSSNRHTKSGFFQQAAAYLGNDSGSGAHVASADEEASDDGDDGTGRLGIGRFTVQKPPSHLLAFRSEETPAKECPTSVTPNGSDESDMEPDPTPTSSTSSRRPGPDMAEGRTPPRVAAYFSQRKASEKASMLEARVSNAAPVQATTSLFPVKSRVPIASRSPPRARPPPSNNGRRPTSAAASSKILAAVPDPGIEAVREPSVSTQGGARRKPPSQVSPRSQNSNFNHIISMFENKPKNAIKPLSENWQYNGASPLNTNR